MFRLGWYAQLNTLTKMYEPIVNQKQIIDSTIITPLFEYINKMKSVPTKSNGVNDD